MGRVSPGSSLGVTMVKKESQTLDSTEQAVLGAAILSEKAFREVFAGLRCSDFKPGWSRTMFLAIGDEHESAGRVERLSLATRLESTKIEGPLEVIDLISAQASSDDDLAGHMRLVLEAAVRRNISALSKQLEKDPDSASVITQQISNEEARLFKKKESCKIGDFAHLALERIQYLYDLGSDITGIATPWCDFNGMTGGLQAGDLIIVAGRPSMGKTMFAVNLAEHTALDVGLPALIVSCEMGRLQITNRVISSVSKVEIEKITRPTPAKLFDDDFSKLSYAVSKLSDAVLYIDDKITTVPEIEQRAEEIKRENGGKLGAVVVDYLQLLNATESKERKDLEVADISKALKQLAKKLGVPIVLLSQLSRKVEERTDKRPLMSDLRESGAIEQDADVIVMMYRDEYYKPDSPDRGIAEAIIVKHRNGPVGTVRLAYRPEVMRFDNLAFDSSKPAYTSQPLGKAKLAVVGYGGENEAFR